MAKLRVLVQDGGGWLGLRFEMWQVFCDLRMADLRNWRHSVLIEKCRMLDPERLKDVVRTRCSNRVIAERAQHPQTCIGFALVPG